MLSATAEIIEDSNLQIYDTILTDFLFYNNDTSTTVDISGVKRLTLKRGWHNLQQYIFYYWIHLINFSFPNILYLPQ